MTSLTEARSLTSPFLFLPCFQSSLVYLFVLTGPPPGHTDRAWDVTWSPTENMLASCSGDKTVRLYRHSTPKADGELAQEDGAVVVQDPKFAFNTSIATGAFLSLSLSRLFRDSGAVSFDGWLGPCEREISRCTRAHHPPSLLCPLVRRLPCAPRPHADTSINRLLSQRSLASHRLI